MACYSGAGSLVQDASADVQSMLQHFLFTLLVPVNPDGYVYSWEVNRMWRKTRSNRSNYLCHGAVAGVDANRNWGVTFGQTNSAPYDACKALYSLIALPTDRFPTFVYMLTYIQTYRHPYICHVTKTKQTGLYCAYCNMPSLG